MALVFWYLSIFNSKLLAIAHVIVISNSDKKSRAMMEDQEEVHPMMKTCFEKKLPLTVDTIHNIAKYIPDSFNFDTVSFLVYRA